MRTSRAIMVGILLGVVALLFIDIPSAKAAPLVNVPVTVTQPDGKVLHIFASGDEYYNWLHDANGYTIIQDHKTGYYVYADLVNGILVPTKAVVGKVDPAAAGLVPNLNISTKQVETIRNKFLVETATTSANEIPTTPTTGTINNLVVFIRFSDESEFSEPTSTYTDMLNSSTAGYNSLYNYYREVSYNTLSINSSLYPTPGGNIVSYQDSHPRRYFQPYDPTTNPDGYKDGNFGPMRFEREQALLSDAVTYVNSLGQFPPAADLDLNNDGYVDSLTFVVHGDPTGWDALLWPHEWHFTSQDVFIGGTKRVYSYAFHLESLIQTGILAHEMFHILGAPDLYHSSSDGVNPVGSWDLMETSFTNPPQHMGCYMKWKYGHWIPNIPELTTNGTYILNPISSPTDNCYKISSPYSATEYFVVEYRSNAGTFESSIPASGLLAYRINTNSEGNFFGPPDEVYIYRPGGTPTINGEVDQANFSMGAGRTAINDSTDPSGFLSNRSSGGLNISNIGTAGATISFDVTLTANSFNNDDFDSATVVNSSYTSTQNTNSATTAGDDPSFPCTSGPMYNSVWYRYTPGITGDVVMDTIGSDFDTVLGVWTGSRGSLTSAGCNDDDSGTQSRINLTLNAGTTYYIEIASHASGGGNLLFHLKTLPPGAFNKTSPADGAVDQATSLTLNWESSFGAASYEYCYDTTNNNACNDWHSNGLSTSTVLSGLEEGTTYYWQVRAYNSGPATSANGSFIAYWSFTTAVSPPSPPGAFNKSSPANGATGRSVNPTLLWANSFNATSYEYCYDTTNDNSCSSWISAGTSTNAVLSNLTPNTTYFWQVRANNPAGTTYAEGSSASFWSFTTSTLPGAFVKSDPSNGTIDLPTSYTLNWESSSGATSYEYCYDTTNDNACSNWISTGPVTGADLSGLSHNTFYYWHVRARNSAGVTYSNDSSTDFWSFKTIGNPGAFIKTSPSNGATNRPTSLTLSWGTGTDATSYEYCYDTTNDNACSNWINNGPYADANVSGLDQSATYYWQVRANNSFGTTYADGSSTAFWSFTTAGPPGAFGKSNPVLGAFNQPTSLSLSWDASSGATSYEYCYDTTNDAACANWTSNGSSTTLALSGLSQGTLYFWHVRAVNSAGTTYSDGLSTMFWWFTTGAPPGQVDKTFPPNGATNQPTSLTLFWGGGEFATSFEYCYDTTNDNACSNWNNTGMVPRVDLSGLSDNTTYYWHVRANNSFGTTYSNGSPTAFWSFTTGSSPLAFSKASPANGSTNQPTSLTLTWDSSSNATSYEYCYDTTNDDACANWTGNGSSTTVDLSGLNPSTTYYWHVRANNSFGTTYANGSATAFWSFTTSANPPGAFNKVSPTHGAIDQLTSLTLSWSPSSGATSYEYCYDTTNDNACSNWTSNGSSTTLALSGLSNSTPYYWHVRAINSGGTTYSDGSSAAFWPFVTGASPGQVDKTFPPNGATNQPTSLTLFWGGGENATSFEYCYDTTNDNACSNWINNGMITYVGLSGLRDNTTYYWHVRAVNSFGTTYSNGSPTAFWSFTTPIVDTTFPVVLSSTRTDPNPTSAASVDYTVMFSEAVTGVTIDDFSLSTTGVTAASITGVSGSGNTYRVTVDTGSGNGTIRLDVVDDNTIIDAASNPLGGVNVGDGDFTSGEVYTIMKIVPTNTPTATPTFTATITSTNTPTALLPNLAIGKSVLVSSFQDNKHTGSMAVDANLATFWESKKSTAKNPLPSEWIVVDLKNTAMISRIELEWNTYYATGYVIQISNDNINWTPVFSETSGDGGNDTILVGPVSARYVRMQSTAWSNSSLRNWLSEFKIFGYYSSFTPTPTPSPTATPTPTKKRH